MQSEGCYFLGADQSPKFAMRIKTLPDLQPHQVLVKNMACGICGTDVHIYEGGKGASEVNPPVVLGHEYAGIVEAVGDAVTEVCVGDHVAIDPNLYCGRCRPCRMGKKQNCQNLQALGVNLDGGMAEYSVCPDTHCFKLNPDVSWDHAAMAEPLACALHGMDRADIRPGENVLVIGGGTIGLLMVQLAKLRGASVVCLSEPVAARREIGLAVGADFAFDPMEETLSSQFTRATGLDGADVVVECVGKPAAAEQAISLAGPAGTVLLFSVPPVDATAVLPLFPVFQKELTILGSMINPDTHQRAVNLINAGRLQLEPLITHRYGLTQVEDAIKMQMSSESIKVMVHPHMR